VEVTGAATNYCWKRRLYNFLSNVTYSPSHRQAGAPVINTQWTLRTARDLRTNASLAVKYYLVAKVIYLQSLRSKICVYIYIYILFTV